MTHVPMEKVATMEPGSAGLFLPFVRWQQVSLYLPLRCWDTNDSSRIVAKDPLTLVTSGHLLSKTEARHLLALHPSAQRATSSPLLPTAPHPSLAGEGSLGRCASLSEAL